VRDNNISWAFNGIHLDGSASDGSKLVVPNVEVYRNKFNYMRDNGIEPEVVAYNHHYYHNVIDNVYGGVISYDDVHGGAVYFYGNTGYLNTTDPMIANVNTWTVYKNKKHPNLPNGKIYIYHNSFYYRNTYWQCDTSATGNCLPLDFLRSYNNAYYHLDGKNMGPNANWKDTVKYPYAPDHEYDNDCSSAAWNTNITVNGQEKNGISSTGNQFVNAVGGDYRLKTGSVCKDKGRLISGFTQDFDGTAPDIGAYEGGKLVEGPPFKNVVPTVGLIYTELPRITRYRVKSNTLKLFFSVPIDTTTISPDSVNVYANGTREIVNNVSFGLSNNEVILSTENLLDGKQIQISFSTMPKGTNGQIATYWGSDIPIGASPSISPLPTTFMSPTPLPTLLPSPTPLTTPLAIVSPSPVSSSTSMTVAIINPVNSASVERKSQLQIKASVQGSNAISQVLFYIDGNLQCNLKGSTNTTYSCNWTVPAKPGVNYRIKVEGYDVAGLKGVAFATVTSSP
jgi:hypothetical protein